MPRRPPFWRNCRGIPVGCTAPRLVRTVPVSSRQPSTTLRDCGTLSQAQRWPRFLAIRIVWSPQLSSPDGSRVVTASADKTARLWDGKSGAELAILLGHADWVNSAAFSSDGSRVVTASFDNTARVWDAKTGAALATLSGHTDRVFSAAFSLDGSRVVTASADKTARVWDAYTGATLAILSGHASQVVSAAFSHDGSLVVTASLDGSARIWRLDPIVLMPGDQREAYVCRDRLIGAGSFTDKEMQEPLLRERDDLRNPCDRVGPLSLDYYRRTVIGITTLIRSSPN